MHWRPFTPIPAVAVAVVVAALLAACDDGASIAGPSGPPQPVPIEQRGPVAISVLGATPVPGSTLSGCGARIAGCGGRVRMRFSLRAQEAGPVLYVNAFLHATNLQACLIAGTGAFPLGQNETRMLELVFDRSDDCAVPLTIATMAVVVEGPVQIASRQAWSVQYTFTP